MHIYIIDMFKKRFKDLKIYVLLYIRFIITLI